MERDLCDFGCGRPAVHIFKNGHVCCSPSITGCPANKKMARETSIRKYGVEHPSQRPYTRIKLSKRTKKRYAEGTTQYKNRIISLIEKICERRKKQCSDKPINNTIIKEKTNEPKQRIHYGMFIEST